MATNITGNITELKGPLVNTDKLDPREKFKLEEAQLNEKIDDVSRQLQRVLKQDPEHLVLSHILDSARKALDDLRWNRPITTYDIPETTNPKVLEQRRKEKAHEDYLAQRLEK